MKLIGFVLPGFLLYACGSKTSQPTQAITGASASAPMKTSALEEFRFRQARAEQTRVATGAVPTWMTKELLRAQQKAEAELSVSLVSKRSFR